eukprot:3470359-Karenia_brevis.AAC.1
MTALEAQRHGTSCYNIARNWPPCCACWLQSRPLLKGSETEADDADDDDADDDDDDDDDDD